MPDDRFTQLTPDTYADTLVADLGDAVDDARDIATELGTRPYVVRLVRTRWAGGRRNVGVEAPVSVIPILPTPRLTNLSDLQAVLQPIGLSEEGDVRLSEISSSFTEEQLRGDTPPLEPDEDFYYEVEYLTTGDRRRFERVSPPYFDALNVQWLVTLRRSKGDRTRQGATRP